MGRQYLSRDLTRALAAYIATAPPTGFLFPGRLDPNRPAHAATYAKVLQRACRAAGLPPLHPHSFRHAWATTLIEEGRADMVYVQRQLGHATIGTTVDLYASSAQPRNLDAVDSLDTPPPPRRRAGLAISATGDRVTVERYGEPPRDETPARRHPSAGVRPRVLRLVHRPPPRR